MYLPRWESEVDEHHHQHRALMREGQDTVSGWVGVTKEGKKRSE